MSWNLHCGSIMQKLVPPFYIAMNFCFINLLWLKSESVLNIVYNFAVRVKRRPFNESLGVRNIWQEGEMTVWLSDDKMTLTSSHITIQRFSSLPDTCKPILHSNMWQWMFFEQCLHYLMIFAKSNSFSHLFLYSPSISTWKTAIES